MNKLIGNKLARTKLYTFQNKKITNYYIKLQVNEISWVVSIRNGIARVYGLNKIQVGEMVEFTSGVKGLAFNF